MQSNRDTDTPVTPGSQFQKVDKMGMRSDSKATARMPDLVILFNGKRKSGKDYFVELLQKRLVKKRIESGIMRISEPIKHFWAEKNKLDFGQLMDASEYKEQHRLDMIKWSMQVRAENYGYFCIEAIKMACAAGRPVWICVDMRHARDYEWFQEFYGDCLKTVKVTADESVRKSRGYVFTEGIDDGPSECALDHVQDWDLVVTNNGTEQNSLNSALDKIMEWVNASVTPSSD